MPLLVVVTLKYNCKYCSDLENVLPSVEDELKGASLVTIRLNGFGDTDKIPKSIKPYVNGYPTILLFHGTKEQLCGVEEKGAKKCVVDVMKGSTQVQVESEYITVGLRTCYGITSFVRQQLNPKSIGVKYYDDLNCMDLAEKGLCKPKHNNHYETNTNVEKEREWPVKEMGFSALLGFVAGKLF